jgi:hypothetical protein
MPADFSRVVNGPPAQPVNVRAPANSKIELDRQTVFLVIMFRPPILRMKCQRVPDEIFRASRVPVWEFKDFKSLQSGGRNDQSGNLV